MLFCNFFFLEEKLLIKLSVKDNVETLSEIQSCTHLLFFFKLKSISLKGLKFNFLILLHLSNVNLYVALNSFAQIASS